MRSAVSERGMFELSRTSMFWACLIVTLGCRAGGGGAVDISPDQPYAPYTNLQVLPEDIEWPELEQAMLNNLRGLGLRRTAGAGCLYCHVGELENPMELWDFASDEKETKRTARVMMQMVRDINEGHLSRLERADSPRIDVTCATCHRGRTNPKPLIAVLETSLAEGGVGQVESEYRELRERYFGRGAYDFSGALTSLGVSLADRNRYDDALRVLALDVEFSPNSVNAHRWSIRVAVERAIVERRVEDLLAVVDSLTSVERPDGAMVWFTLRSVGVRLRRAGRLDGAEMAFELNALIYDNDHRVITDLAEIRLARGDTTNAIANARRALTIRPGYERAEDLLAELRVRR